MTCSFAAPVQFSCSGYLPSAMSMYLKWDNGHWQMKTQAKSKRTDQEPSRKPRPSSRQGNAASGCNALNATTTYAIPTIWCQQRSKRLSSHYTQAITVWKTTSSPSLPVVNQNSDMVRQAAIQQNNCCTNTYYMTSEEDKFALFSFSFLQEKKSMLPLTMKANIYTAALSNPYLDKD